MSLIFGLLFGLYPELDLKITAYFYDAAAKTRSDNARWVEIEKSQKNFAERAVRWDLDTNVSRRMAYAHYFGKKPSAKPEAKKKS